MICILSSAQISKQGTFCVWCLLLNHNTGTGFKLQTGQSVMRGSLSAHTVWVVVSGTSYQTLIASATGTYPKQFEHLNLMISSIVCCGNNSKELT